MIQREICTQLIAGMIGALTGISVAAFKLCIERIRELCYGGHVGLNFVRSQDDNAAPYFVVVPVIGALGVTILKWTGEFNPGLKGVVKEVDDMSLSYAKDLLVKKEDIMSLPMSGEDDNAVQRENENEENNRRLLDPLRSIRKALAAVVTLGTGNSLGPEGPGVEIGAAISRVGMNVWPPKILDPPNVSSSTTTGDFWTRTGQHNNVQVAPSDTAAAAAAAAAASIQSTFENITIRNRLLLACGAASGVSSGFNAPLSGVFFALEVVQSSLGPLSVSCPLLLQEDSGRNWVNEVIELPQKPLSGNSGSIAAILSASVVAALVTRLFLGDELALRVLQYDIQTPLSELPLYMLLGCFCGVVSVAFSQTRILYKAFLEGNAGPKVVRDVFRALPASMMPVVGGLVCGGVGYFFPEVLFFGYETLNGLLQNETLPTTLLLSLLLAKMTATAVCMESGLVGGILAPSLFLGGMTGAIFHNVVCQIFKFFSIDTNIVVPSYGQIFDLAGVPIYSSVGAASVLAATFRAPLTASLLLFEITRNYDVLLPILASAGIASLSSDILKHKLES